MERERDNEKIEVSGKEREESGGEGKRRELELEYPKSIRNADLVVLEVPAFNLLVLTSREEVGLPGADSEGPHTADVARQSQLQTA